MTAYQFGYVVALAACSFAGYKMCENKGRDPWLGGLLGFFLGLIGLLIVALLKEQKRPIAATAPGGYVQPASSPAFPVQTAQWPQPAMAAGGQPYVAPSGQQYVAPRVPQYAAPQPPQAPPGSQPS